MKRIWYWLQFAKRKKKRECSACCLNMPLLSYMQGRWRILEEGFLYMDKMSEDEFRADELLYDGFDENYYPNEKYY